MLIVKGIGLIIITEFLAEIGDVRNFELLRQIQMPAGFSLRENDAQHS